MNLKDFYIKAYELTEQDMIVSVKEIENIYKQIFKDLDKQIQAQYLKYLSAVDTKNYYNEMIKYDRLVNLEKQIQTTYLSYYKQISKQSEQALRVGFSNLYYRQAFISKWLEPELLVGALPDELIELTVLGTKDSWKKITQSIKDKFGDMNLYQPQIGTLSKLLKENAVNTIDDITRQITIGLNAGYSYPQISKSLYEIIGSKNVINGVDSYSGALYKSLRIVRTEGTRVMNDAGYAQTKWIESQGYEVYKLWIATLDTNTRSTHASLDGEKILPDEYFDIDGDKALSPGNFSLVEHNVNCLTGYNKIWCNSKIKKLYKRYYNGLIYRIKTSSGIELSITPNHEIFTPNGWIAAKSLNECSEIFNVRFRKPFLGSKPKINNIPIMIEKVFDFFDIIFPSERITSIKEYFHGDGIIDSDIDIIFIDSKLMNCIKPIFNKIFKNFNFSFAYNLFIRLFNYCSFNKFIIGSFFVPNRIMSSICLIKSFFFRHLAPFKKFCFTFISLLKSEFIKISSYCNSGYIKLFGKFFNGKTGFMQLDKIIKIDVVNFKGHVYNLENNFNLYYANSSSNVNNYFAIVHNCRCSLGDMMGDWSPQARRGRNPTTGENEVFSYKDFDKWRQDNGLEKNKYGEIYLKK